MSLPSSSPQVYHLDSTLACSALLFAILSKTAVHHDSCLHVIDATPTIVIGHIFFRVAFLVAVSSNIAIRLRRVPLEFIKSVLVLHIRLSSSHLNNVISSKLGTSRPRAVPLYANTPPTAQCPKINFCWRCRLTTTTYS